MSLFEPLDRISFLTLKHVKHLHLRAMERSGGAVALRDVNALISAVQAPQAMFSGQYFHTDLRTMAAAYLFHLCQNHPFLDGNKRVATLSALVFLKVNRDEIYIPCKDLTGATFAVASGQMSKEELVVFFKKY